MRTAWLPCVTAANFLEMEVHGVGVGIRRNQGRAYISTGADSAEDVGRLPSPITRRGRTTAAFCPDPGQCALLTNSGFVLPPDFDRFCARMLGDCGVDQIGKVFLCASCAMGSCCGWSDRTGKRRNPSRRNIAPTLRSAKVTLNWVLMTRARSTRRQRTTP